ncbi:hypothetical protein [Actinomadura madurae]|uniref:hypothetical protein n=1 Tax=Actinomadura madurae TaxID=1993 RepID=UPI002025BDEC|nr:hypothetical protein [Actinomadura madurae]MCP9970623.1 hypothetical protein [Actinomadura madurae]MCP9983093.1 hypothetical protein [Actinomadura madurae]MCQ0005348.1 hypothetical protein [Actinomadura madurae]MCQ0019339.1 hypothetical protein [Actinomadura madurae]URM99357.1 hypothetical protein LUW76_36305 [Actinomadura madurae]
MRDERILDLLITYLREGNVADPVISLFADLGDPRGIPVLRDYITELEASDPEEGVLRRRRDHYLDKARTALARLDPDCE